MCIGFVRAEDSPRYVPRLQKNVKPSNNLSPFMKWQNTSSGQWNMPVRVEKALPADPNSIPDEPDYMTQTGVYHLPKAMPVERPVFEGKTDPYAHLNDITMMRQRLIEAYNERFGQMDADFSSGKLSPQAYQAEKFYLQQEYQRVIDTE